jgi:localization factor PodJL
MKSAMPWNIKGIDEETREAAREAARNSGLSVSEWLNQTIAKRAAEEGIDPAWREADDDPSRDEDELRKVAGSLADLTRRIRAMDANSRAAISGLKDRLDEIEEHLGRANDAGTPSGRRTGQLQGVSAMVDSLAREIDNADEAARSMVEGLRARAAAVPRGTPVGRENENVSDAIRVLDARIAAMADRITPPPPPVEPPARLDDLRSRLNALLARGPERAPTGPAARAASLDATLKALEERIAEAKARSTPPPAAAPPPSFEERERLQRIEERLADISGRLDQPRDEPPPALAPAAPPEPVVDELTAAIAEISARQRMLDERADATAMRRDQKKIADAVATLRTDVAGLVARVASIHRHEAEDGEAYFGLARRIEALAAETPVDRGIIAGIRNEIDALRAITESGARESTLVDKLDDLARRTPDRNRVDALGEEVSAMRRALENAESPKAIARVEMRVNEVARAVEAALNSRQVSVDAAAAGMAAGLADLRHTIDQLSAAARKTDAATADAVVAGLAASLDEIRQAIDARGSAGRQPDRAAVERLESRLDQIVSRIEVIADRSAPADVINGLHDRLEALVERFDRSVQGPGQPVALDEVKAEISAIRAEIAGREPPRTEHLEDQIRDLAMRLETATRPDADIRQLADLEAQVARLAAELEKSIPRNLALQQVEENLVRLQSHLTDQREESVAAARRAARDAVREFAGNGIDSELIRALRQDLDHIRHASGAGDATAQQTLQSLHGTLATVVDRLGRLEDETGSATLRPEARAMRPPAAEATGEPAILPPSAGSRPSVETRLREPGSGKPDIAALRELAAGGGEPARDRASDRRADFIAAARRAAQAAVAENAASEAGDRPRAEPRQSPFARIGAAIRGRRKPLLLAAAAIVLAIGAMQAFEPGFAGKAKSAVVARIDPPAPAATRAPLVPPIQKTRGLSAEAASAALQSAQPAMVLGPVDARTAIALAAPDSVVSRFGDASPDAQGFSADANEPAAAGPAAAPEPAPVEPTQVAAIGSDRLRNAAAAGDPAAAFEIATRYAEGRGVGQDLATAAEWYRKSAESGVAVAQYRLSSLYERGQGVKKDLSAAVDWYQRAADQGNVGAMHNLAVLMSEGVDGTPDHARALQWFLAAGDYGVKDSQYNLGVIYARGIGTGRDMTEAYKWFAIAAAQGDTDAAARRDEVGGMLAPDQLAKARAAVQAWRVKAPLPEANGVSAPAGGWDGVSEGVTEADRRALVKKIQTLLTDRGYDPGPTDGVEGPKTREAVRAFQRTAGISDTGQIGPDLVTALADQ